MSCYHFVPAAAVVVLSTLAVGALRLAVLGGLPGVDSIREDVVSDAELGAQLELVSVELQRRIAIKESLVADLVAGRATLAYVAEQFLALNQGRPEIMRVIRATCPGRSDLEKSAHNVVEYAEGELSRCPAAQQDEVRRRLLGELKSLFRGPAPHG